MDVPLDHVARIARIALTAEEKQRFAAEARAILAHFEAIEGAGRAEPASPSPLAPRADDVVPPEAAQVEALVAQLPRKEGRRAKVPEGL